MSLVFAYHMFNLCGAHLPISSILSIFGAVLNVYGTNCSGAPSIVWNLHFLVNHTCRELLKNFFLYSCVCSKVLVYDTAFKEFSFHAAFSSSASTTFA